LPLCQYYFIKDLLMLILSEKNTQYPAQLQRLHSPPKQLFVDSQNWEELLQMPMLAVVGTRKPSSYGASASAQIIREVASRGVCIVSGLALGTDSIAHNAALEVGGATIAVLPSGLDTIYPASHRQLAKDIATNGGALVTEFTPKSTLAFKSNFIQRNRIIAGISNAVFIPEAAAKSGSLHTAQFALESGIDVCAMPGLISNPLAEGCHNLIKAGAGVITSADDILAVLGISAEHHASQTANSPEEKQILDAITQGIHDADEIFAECTMPITQFNQTLTMLEIQGRIFPRGGNTWFIR
jgi:DNA processing protein